MKKVFALALAAALLLGCCAGVHADPVDAKPGTFSGPAVRPLPTNFVQN